VRIVILAPSVYSETSCATAAHLAAIGHVPAGGIALPSLHSATLFRKVGQWGAVRVLDYARAKLIPRGNHSPTSLVNPHLDVFLQHGSEIFHSLREVGSFYGFPVALCNDQNAASISRLRDWSPDLIIFTGGEILRPPLLEIPRLGVLNLHLGLLPEIRGMSSPEWSLLTGVPVGITIHYMNAGVDTGPVLKRCEFNGVGSCESLSDLRNRLIAFGIEKVAEAVCALAHGTISATPQSDLDQDNQFFVMHQWLQARASERLHQNAPGIAVEAVHE